MQIMLVYCVGHLDPVDSLVVTEQNHIISLTWEPPFTLDIPEDPDIEGYCVDVFNSDSNILIHTECGLNTSLFSYTTDDSACYNYLFTVKPVNVVGNGTSNNISYFGAETSKLKTFKLLASEFPTCML